MKPSIKVTKDNWQSVPDKFRKRTQSNGSDFSAFKMLDICPFPLISDFSRIAFQIYAHCEGSFANYGQYNSIPNIVVECFMVIKTELNKIESERIAASGNAK